MNYLLIIKFFLIILQPDMSQLCWLTVKIISMRNLHKADLCKYHGWHVYRLARKSVT